MNKTIHIQEEAARCLMCADAPCSKACKKGDPARAIRAIRFGNEALAIDFCGLHCENPFFLASSAVCTNYDMVSRLKQGGRVCSTRPSAWKTSTRCRRASMLSTRWVARISSRFATWNN